MLLHSGKVIFLLKDCRQFMELYSLLYLNRSLIELNIFHVNFFPNILICIVAKNKVMKNEEL